MTARIKDYGHPDKWTFEDAQRIINALTAVDGYDEDEILKIVTDLNYDLFMALDEKPGWFDGQYYNNDWHWKLRRARNQAEGFFEAIQPWHP